MSDRLRIGVLCHPTYGGSGVVASELAISLAESGHEVHLFSHEVPPRLAVSAGMVQMHRAQGVPYPLFHSTPHDLAITSAILDVHRATGLDVLHAHYALPHAVSAFLARSAAETDPGRPAPRTVTTLHGTDITLVGNDPSYAPLTQFVIQASDAATAVSHWLARETVERFCPTMRNGTGIEVIPNFVDTARFHPEAASGASLCGGRGCPVAVHVSNFRAVKQVPWLVSAFAAALRGREARLVLVGDGPEQAASRAAALELGVADSVLFLGERDALPELLAPADVFVLASRQESFGLSALEAMSCGTPVVSTDSGGIVEVVEDGVTGLLSPQDDLAAFADNLSALLFDATRAKAMGAAAREVALTRFRWEHIVERYVELYRRTLEGPR
ncbi:MAG TPA: N-acetyl-alpha-D-glucosaminyl L-malate synthase BshA [Planctomycetota bacterium]|nr:N-acetyl-alpha-D-glucosaminyl L-malate synthase BshA [Planctomycetota bacterium]